MKRVMILLEKLNPFKLIVKIGRVVTSPKFISFAVPVGVTFLDNVGTIARVEGISMQPEFNPHRESSDFIYLNRWSTNFYSISKGDIVTLISPMDPDVTIVKRIVGLESDIIRTKGYKNEYVKVPQGHCWVEGDNTEHSADSNSFGPVSIGLITGKADYIIWPPARWRSLKLKKEEKT